MRLLLDQGMPRGTVQHLEDRGIEALHVAELGLSRAADADILERARADGSVIVTLDADFHTLLALSGASNPTVIRIRREGLRALDMANLIANIAALAHERITAGAMLTVTERGLRIRRLPVRQTILQLAVRGQLINVLSGSGPATALLEEVAKQRAKFLAHGKIKRARNPAEDEPQIAPYPLPPGWAWSQLGELILFGPRNGFSPRSVDYPTSIKTLTLTLTAVTSGYFEPTEYKYLDIEIEADSHLWLEEGDILIQRANSLEYVGVSAIYRGPSAEFIYPDLMMKIRAAKGIHPEFLHLALLAPSAREHMRRRATGTSGSMPKINQQTVNSIPIPVPPTLCQKAIVTKVNHLMALCDELEAKLQAHDAKAQRFAEAVVAELAPWASGAQAVESLGP